MRKGFTSLQRHTETRGADIPSAWGTRSRLKKMRLHLVCHRGGNALRYRPFGVDFRTSMCALSLVVAGSG